MSERKKVATEIGLIGLVCVIIIVAIMLPWSWDEDIAPLPPRPAQFTDSVPDAVERTLDSCVHVVNVTRGWQGSAFAVAPDILITAGHVNEGGREFLITTADGEEYIAYQAISSKKYDIGFIKLEEPVLHPALVGNIGKLRLGQPVYVIGGSLGKMNWPNVTVGAISCLNRDLESFGAPLDFGWSILWQVDAATYPGNSGGPIFTLDGVVRGILVGGIGGSECLSYCVPLEVAVPDLNVIRLLFIADEYEVEEAPVYDSYGEYYNWAEGNEYY